MRPPSMSDAQAIQMLRRGQSPMPEYVFEDDRASFDDWDAYLEHVLLRNRKTWMNIIGKALTKG
jgi:hypothetical protein